MKAILKIVWIGVFIFFLSCSKDDSDPAPQLNASFSSEVTTVLEGESVQYSDGSTGDVISWTWAFEGGDPLTSTEQNPVVKYVTEGEYDVSLTVKNANSENSKTIVNYITVEPHEIPEEFDIAGTWERVESNNPALNGMQVTVNSEETEGEITSSPNSLFPEGELKWKDMVKISEHEYLFSDMFSDGTYLDSISIFIIAYGNELIIGNFLDSGSGSFQRWERVDFQYPENENYNLIGNWKRTKSNNPEVDGMIVSVDSDQSFGEISYSPVEDDFAVGTNKWTDIEKENKNNRYVIQDLNSAGIYTESRLFLTAKGLELVIGTFNTNAGSFQKWTRE